MEAQVQYMAKREVPCAACKMQHRKCSYDCMLAPYFPPNEVEKFAIVHKVFGASNVIKMLQGTCRDIKPVDDERAKTLMQMVDDMWREDAVKSLVYEAYARLKNPVYGCTIAISYLQKCVKELEEQLKATQVQLLKSEEQMERLSLVLDSLHFPSSGMFDDGNFDSTMHHDAPFTNPIDYYNMI